MGPDNDALLCIWSKPGDYVPIRPSCDLEWLLSHSAVRLRKFLTNVGSGAIKILWMCGITRKERLREHAHVGFQPGG